jgi:XRE family aerobic/anaerobic benzoate catabolism transcriptional regulator
VLYSAYVLAKAHDHSRPAKRRETFLAALGAAVRSQRTARHLTLKELAHAAHLSPRFLLQLEAGEGNVSVARLLDIAEALGTTPSALLETARVVTPSRGVVALVGLRGAGKSTLGALAAKELGVPFVELDALVAKKAGMSLPVIFEMHGEAHFRKLERDVLKKFLADTPRAVLATSGSIVTDKDTYALLREHATTIWLRAEAGDHLKRVVAQGDLRPMQGRPAASRELEGLLRARQKLYAQAVATIDTSSLGLEQSVQRIVRVASSEIGPKRDR